MNAKSQNKEAIAIAGVGMIAAGVASAIAFDQMKESVELTATEYILKNHKEMYAFNLSVLGFNITKSSDLSNTSILSFGIQSLDPNTNKYEKYILFSNWSRPVASILPENRQLGRTGLTVIWKCNRYLYRDEFSDGPKRLADSYHRQGLGEKEQFCGPVSIPRSHARRCVQ